MATPAELTRSLDEIVSSNSLKEVKNFLQGGELSNEDYTKLYNSTKTSLDGLVTGLNTILTDVSSRRSEFDSDIISKASDLKRSIAAMKDQFYNGYILTPAQHKEKLGENSPVELGSLSIRSSWNDVSLKPEELSQLRPEKLLARTDGGVEYYQVTFNGKTTILRYNSTDSGDEVALYELKDIDLKSLKNDDIKRLIINAERQTAFKDVEMDGTASARNILPGLGAGAGAGISATVLGGALPASMGGVLGGAAVGLAGVGAAVASVPGVIVMGGSVVIGGIVASMTDLDYTSDDYKKDFGSDMAKSKKRVLSYMRK